MRSGAVKWRDRLGRLVRWEYFPFLAFGLFMLALHMTFNTMLGDDDAFALTLAKDGPVLQTWWKYIVGRYNDWSSRVVIESFLIFMVHAPLLWKVLDTLVLVLIGVLFSRFFNHEHRRGVDWFIVYALLAFPLRLMRTAGWISTSMNYTWPLVLSLIALLPLVDAVQRRTSRLWERVLSIVVLPYALNHEQMCCVFLAVVVFLVVWLRIRDGKINWLGICQIVLGLAMLAFMFTCPGNAKRDVKETAHWFPEFANLSFLQKCELGYSSTLFQCIMEPNLVFSLLALVLLLTVCLYDKRTWARLVAAIPIGAALIMGTFGVLSEQVLPYLAGMRNAMTDTGTGFRLFNFCTWPPDVFVGFVTLCLLAALWLAFRSEGKLSWVFPVYLTLVGLASRMVIGFSPTVWASRERTFTYLYFALLAVAVMLVRRLLLHPRNGRWLKLLYAGIAIHAVFIVEEYMYYLTKI